MVMNTTLAKIKEKADLYLKNSKHISGWHESIESFLKGSDEVDIAKVLNDVGIWEALYASIPIRDERLQRLAVFAAKSVAHLAKDHEDNLLFKSLISIDRILNKTASKEELDKHSNWIVCSDDLSNSQKQANFSLMYALARPAIFIGYDLIKTVQHVYNAVYEYYLENGLSNDASQDKAEIHLSMIAYEFERLLKR